MPEREAGKLAEMLKAAYEAGQAGEIVPYQMWLEENTSALDEAVAEILWLHRMTIRANVARLLAPEVWRRFAQSEGVRLNPSASSVVRHIADAIGKAVL